MTAGLLRSFSVLVLAGLLFPADDAAWGGVPEPSCMLVFPRVELRWDADNHPIGDTFIELSNNQLAPASVQMCFVNGDSPWVSVDNHIPLTPHEPSYWSALTGWPKGVSPFAIVATSDPPGLPTVDGSGDRVLRGFILAWDVNASGENACEHLSGHATLINYLEGTAWEYNPAVVVADAESPGLAPAPSNADRGVSSGLLLNFHRPGSVMHSGPRNCRVVDTELTLLPVSLEGTGPLRTPTEIELDIWNTNKFKFSGVRRRIEGWDQQLLSGYDAPGFLQADLRSEAGTVRILNAGRIGAHGVLVGVASTVYQYDNGQRGRCGAKLIRLADQGFGAKSGR